MKRPQTGDMMQLREDTSVKAPVLGVSEHEVVMDLDGEPYGFSWSMFCRLFEPSERAA